MKKKLKKQQIKEKLIFEGGSSRNEDDQKSKELEILNYPKTAIKLWKQDPKKNSELPILSLFMQLNYGESDLMASFEEMDKLFTYINPVKDSEGNEIGPLQRARQAFDKFQVGGFLDFRQFQQFMKEVDLEEDANAIDLFLYKYYFRRNCCTLLLQKCCIRPFRGMRMKQIANRMKKMMELENQIKPTKPVGLPQIIQACVTVFGGYAQLFDFYTDIIVLYHVYIVMFELSNPLTQNQINDHQWALIILFTSLTASFLAQQSCIIGMKFAQGDFEPHNFKALGCFGRLVNIMILTFIGVLFTGPIEILDNLCKMFTLPGLLFGGANGVQKVQSCFMLIKQKLTRLNGYQLNCLEQQRKITALLFENLPFALLIVIVQIGYMDVDALKSPTATISLYSSLVQVGVTLLTTYIESRWLKESTLTYLMTKTTANNNWIPFIHKITKRDCDFNINFGDLAIDIPFATHVMGFQMVTQYEFSDNTLNYLLNELKLWSSEIRGQPQKQRYRLIFTKDCLNQVSLNTFIHFVQNFPEDVFILEIQLDWQKFYDLKQIDGQIEFTIEDGEKRMYSPIGLPLLQLCIQNEASSGGKWPLKEMLLIILKSGHYNLYDSKHGSPLTIALQGNCFESIHIINSGDYNFDIQQQDAEGKSFIGYLIKKILEDPEQKGLEFEKLVGFSQSIFRELKLDLHKEQFENIGTVKKQISGWQLIFKSLRHHRTIRHAIRILISFADRQGNFDLNDKEKNTLFKSSVKCIMSYGRDSRSAWSKMSSYSIQCKVNIFETKDSLNKGLEHRLIKLWPIQFIDARTVEAIFRPFLTATMNKESIKPVKYIFEKVVSEGLVVEILQKSIFTAKVILRVDHNSGQQIKSFNDKEQSLVIRLLVKAMITNQECYTDLVNVLEPKIPDFRGRVSQQIRTEVKEQTQGEKSQAKQDDKQQDDQAEFEGSKLTRRKPANGNLKRNVTNELQQDPPLIRLTPQQIQNLGIVEYSPEVARRKVLGNILRTTLETILEWIAAADLYTDALVFVQLYQTQHHAWTTITIFSLLAPFFACQTPFLMFLKEQVYRDKNDRLKLQLMGYIMVQPLMLGYLFCLDVIFIVNQAVLFPLIQVLKLLTCGLVNLSILNRALDKSYEYFFEMKKLEVAGFRRMRTISQLTFESLIQVTLQIRILMYYGPQKMTEGQEELGVSVTAILVSIMLAITHALLECIFLYMESQASKTSFTNYCIVCFNGRFGWVPYNDYLIKTSQEMQDDSQEQKKQEGRVELDFQNIESKLCCFDLQVEFVFSDDTILSLTKTLASFPPIENEKDMPHIKFGHTVDNVSLENLESLLRVCKGKVLIDLQGTDLHKIYMNSRYSKLLQATKVEDLTEQDNKYLFDLHKSKLTQLLFFILKHNNENLRAEMWDEKHQKKMNFAKIAYEYRDSELLELLLCLNSDIFKAQMSEVENRNSLTVRLLNTIDFDIWLTIASNSDTFNPHQESLIFQAFMNMQTADPALFRRSMKWWHGRFGPCMPQEVIQDVMRYSPAHDFMKEYKKMYPQKVYMRSGKHYIEVEAKTAFCFPLIRKKLVNAWDINASGPSIDPKLSEGTLSRPMDISDLEISLSDFKLLNMLLSDSEHGQIKNLTGEKVQELDDLCYKLKMDTYRWLYVGRTRVGDQTGSQIDVIFYGKDVHCPEDTHQSARYEIEAGFNRKFDDPNDDEHTYQKSLQIEMPENMQFMTYHKSYHKKPAKNSAMSTFIHNKDTVLRGYLFCYAEQRNLVEQGDVTILAQKDEQGRVEAIKSAKPIYQIDTVKPGAKVQYCPQSLWAYTTMQNLRITMSIDFPMNADLDKEQTALEEQAQRKKEEHTKSIEAFNDELQYHRNRN